MKKTARDTRRQVVLRACALLGPIALIHAMLLAQEGGEINGHVKNTKSGEAVISANVLLKGTSRGSSTDANGAFSVKHLARGMYTLVFSAVGYSTVEQGPVQVNDGASVTVDAALEETDVSLAVVEVYGASLRRERITETPAAVSVIEAGDIKLNGAHGQLPRLFETEPGVDIVQSGMQDFNINTRGFNSVINRRLLVLMDGRDLAIAFLGAQEWNGLSIPLEDIGRMELVRGPGSALYGPNAYNGVISITTPSPREVLGTKISLSGGELDFLRADVRQAGLLNDRWSYRFNFGRVQSSTWSKSRTLRDTTSTGEFEYPGLRSGSTLSSGEAIPLDNNHHLGTTYGSARVDYNFENADIATLEGGLSQVQNETFLTGIGRVQVKKADKPWGRFHFGSEHLNIILWGQGRSSLEPQYALETGAPLQEHSSIFHAEAQYHFTTLGNQMRVILGASHRFYRVGTDSTLMASDHNDNTSGIFGQVEYTPVRWLKLVGASRWDRSTLHSPEFSPKAALVWIPSGDHSLRLTFNQAFLVPNYSQYFLQVGAGSADLSGAGLNPRTPVYALGNSHLTVEHITGYELGYKGIFLNGKLYTAVDFYSNQLQDFVTELLQGVNPDHPYEGPAGLHEVVPGLTIFHGDTAIVVSYTNAGRVDEQGVEAALTYYLSNELHVDGSWTWYDFSVVQQRAGENLIPNAPRHKFAFGATYRSRSGYEFGVSGRNVQPFHWVAGIYEGDIPAYTVVNISGGYQITPTVRLGFAITNALDKRVYQAFGGSIIGRQAIANATLYF